MDVVQLVEQIRLDGCMVYPANGQPSVESDHGVPDDVRVFYELCGGIMLYPQAEYPIEVVPPERCVLANPVIVGELCDYDITSTWYIIARDRNNEVLTIDFSFERLGRCYDSFSDRHGVRGSCPIIATSLTDLLRRMLDNRGGYPYWLSPTFSALGDAYD